MKRKKTLPEMIEIVRQMKRDVFLMAYHSGTKGAHVGGAMSCMEILAVLYADVMNYDAARPEWENRDRFVLSKAHCAIGLYAALKFAGFLTEAEIEGAMQKDSPYFKHPKMNVAKGIEFSGGSLGQGLSLAVGSALALRLQGKEARFYVLLGDGELDEGSVWEALNSVVQYQLQNITVIVDRNRLQNDGTTEKVMNKGDLKKRLEAIGFDAMEVDGHNIEALRGAFEEITAKPKVMIANTRKGNAISFAEDKVDWHINYVNEELYRQAIREIG